MAVSQDTTVTGSGANISSLSIPITIGNNDKRFLAVGIGLYNSGGSAITVDSVTIGGQNLTNACSSTMPISSYGAQYIWYIIAPPTGSQTIVITLSGSCLEVGAGAMSLYNVDQVSGIKTASTVHAGGNNQFPETDIVTAVNHSFIFGNFAYTTAFILSGQSTAWVNVGSISNAGYIADASPAGSNTIQQKQTTSSGWASGAIEILLNTGLDQTKTASDSPSFTDTIKKDIKKGISDILTFGENLIPNITKSVSDTIITTDIVAKAVNKMVTDSINTGESGAKFVYKLISDAILSSDEAFRGKVVFPQEFMQFTETISKSITKSINDNISLIEAAGKGQFQSVSEALSLIDSAAVGIGTAVIDDMMAGESIVRNVGKVIMESPGLTESLIKMISYHILDNIVGDDSVTLKQIAMILYQSRNIKLNPTTSNIGAEGEINVRNT